VCRYKGHLKLAGERGDKSDFELLQAESRERVRPAATRKLLARQVGNAAVLPTVASWQGARKRKRPSK
jgi:hypothetical protein